MKSLHFEKSAGRGTTPASKFRTGLTILATGLAVSVAGMVSCAQSDNPPRGPVPVMQGASGAPTHSNQNKKLGRQLINAAKKGDLHRVKELIGAGADVNSVYSGHSFATKFNYYLGPAGYVDMRDPDGSTALMQAALNGHTEVVGYLISKGADLDVQTANGSNSVLWATLENHYDIVKRIIDARLVHTVSHSDEAALEAAAISGNLPIVKLLLDAGVRDGGCFWCGSDKTALQEAIDNGHPEIARLLIERGVPLDRTCFGGYNRTALMSAIGFGQYAIVKLLVEKGADVNAKGGPRNETPLMIACDMVYSSATDSIVRLLVESGADVNAKDMDGKTALRHIPAVAAYLKAGPKKLADIRHTLEQHGAKQ